MEAVSDKGRRLSLFYGYFICLIAVTVVLVSIGSAVDAAFNLSDPIHVTRYDSAGPSADLSSFETYKLGMAQQSADAKVAATTSDVELQAAYAAAVDGHNAGVRLDAWRTITGSVIMILVAAGLFILHWRWVNRLIKA